MHKPSSQFGRIHSAPAYQMVAQAIEEKILSGRLRPGDPLGTEADLVRQFGVNRSTVREGIRLLEDGGFVHRNRSRRLQVSLPRSNRLATRTSRALVLHQVTFRELWEAAMNLEAATVEAAALRATPQDIAALENNVARMAKAPDTQAFCEIDSEFHMMLAQISKNRVLELAREPAGILFVPTLKMIMDRIEAAGPRNVEAHSHIVEACRSHDVVAARDWMRRHIIDWRRGFEIAGKSLDDPVEHVYAQHRGTSSRRR